MIYTVQTKNKQYFDISQFTKLSVKHRNGRKFIASQ
jgi:hypothetical protein